MDRVRKQSVASLPMLAISIAFILGLLISVPARAEAISQPPGQQLAYFWGHHGYYDGYNGPGYVYFGPGYRYKAAYSWGPWNNYYWTNGVRCQKSCLVDKWSGQVIRCKKRCVY